MPREARGAPGVDGVTLRGRSRPGAWRRGWKRCGRSCGPSATGPSPVAAGVDRQEPGGGQRPLGIPTVRDRVVQAAVVVVLEPIFEADLPRNQFGFRPNLDAKMAVRRAYWHITQSGRTEVVDADLSDYFGSIPHGPI